MKNNTMMGKKLALGLLVLALTGCVSPFFMAVSGSGAPGTNVRVLSGVDKVILEGAGEIILLQGDKESVKITTDDNLLPYVDAFQEGSSLRLGFRKGMSFHSSLGVRMEVTVKDLRSVGLIGVGNIRGNSLNLGSLDVSLEGTGDVVLSGNVQTLNLSLSGTGSVQARDLTAAAVSVVLSGVGNADVQASTFLDARISGVGNIQYWGNPTTVRSSVSGLGAVQAK